MKKINLITVIIIIIVIIIPSYYARALIGEYVGRFISADKVVNNFKVGDVDIEIKENFNPPEKWEGNEHKKEVFIENLSKSEALIRVNITPRWADKEGNPVALDSSKETVNLTFKNVNGDPGWIKGADGYYYYNKLVATGDKTVAILDGVAVVISDGGKKQDYKRNKLIIDIKSEAVQATKDGYNTAWANITDSTIKEMLDNLCIR